MRSRVAAVLVTAVCAVPSTVNAAKPGPAFGTPVKVNGTGWGYEPSIDVDSRGTLYVTAHKGSVANEGTRLSSFLWSSRDGGTTWTEMTAPARLTDAQFSFEGDIALDAKDRLYFADTYGADNWLSRWDEGAWERSAPAVTTSVFDDRPWIATQGDETVWLLTTDVVTHAPANGLPETTDGSGWASSAVLYRSADGGVTWSPGHAFADAQFCGLATSAKEVVVACVTRGDGGGQRLVTHRSADGGTTWKQQAVYAYRGRADSFVSVAYDRGGTPVVAFADGLPAGHRLHVAYGTSVRDVTPFRGAFQHVWVAADGKGRTGLAFYGTKDTTATAASDWYVYGGVAGQGRTWSIARADPKPVLRAAFAPADFLQCVIAPDGRLYVAYSRAATTDALHAPPPDFDHDIYVARQRP